MNSLRGDFQDFGTRRSSFLAKNAQKFHIFHLKKYWDFFIFVTRTNFSARLNLDRVGGDGGEIRDDRDEGGNRVTSAYSVYSVYLAYSAYSA